MAIKILLAGFYEKFDFRIKMFYLTQNTFLDNNDIYVHCTDVPEIKIFL